MAWHELELRLRAQQLPRAEALLDLLGAASVTLLGSGPDEILEPEPGTTPVWPITRVRALFPDETDLKRLIRVIEDSLGGGVHVHAGALDDAVWRAALVAVPREQSIGQRLLIGSAQSSPRHPGRVVVRLNRGLGFGTGEHPTTQLCLEWLEAELQPETTVLDYGCGSGILAIAALALGAGRAFAVDIDSQALEATRANAALNGVGHDLWVGSPGELPDLEADVILANILARPLIELAPRFRALVSEAGTVVLSGALVTQRDEILETYSADFAVLAARELDGWLSIVCRG